MIKFLGLEHWNSSAPWKICPLFFFKESKLSILFWHLPATKYFNLVIFAHSKDLGVVAAQQAAHILMHVSE